MAANAITRRRADVDGVLILLDEFRFKPEMPNQAREATGYRASALSLKRNRYAE